MGETGPGALGAEGGALLPWGRLQQGPPAAVGGEGLMGGGSRQALD